MSEPVYDASFFIQKFSAIDPITWCIVHLTVNRVVGIQHCALGHCGEECGTETAESHALKALFIVWLGLAPETVNDLRGYSADGKFLHPYQQPTPKARILAALHDIKAKQEQELELAGEAFELRPLNLTRKEKVTV